MAMNPEIKARWTAWLRAHADEQGRGYLHCLSLAESVPEKPMTPRKVGYCCLGGLCELAVADGVITAEEGERNGDRVVWYGDGRDKYVSSFTDLPGKVLSWAGLRENSALQVMVGRQSLSLIALNDNQRWDFFQIADIIDEQL